MEFVFRNYSKQFFHPRVVFILLLGTKINLNTDLKNKL